MAAQLPGALDDRASAEALDLVRMQAKQQARRQRQPAQQLELADLGQQALQPDPSGISGKAGERRALAVIGQQSIQALARAGVEVVRHTLQPYVVVRGAGGTQDAVEAVGARSGDPPAREPAGDLLLQGCGPRLA